MPWEPREFRETLYLTLRVDINFLSGKRGEVNQTEDMKYVRKKTWRNVMLVDVT